MESSFHLNFIQLRSIPIISSRFKLEDICDLARFFREFLCQKAYLRFNLNNVYLIIFAAGYRRSLERTCFSLVNLAQSLALVNVFYRQNSVITYSIRT